MTALQLALVIIGLLLVVVGTFLACHVADRHELAEQAELDELDRHWQAIRELQDDDDGDPLTAADWLEYWSAQLAAWERETATGLADAAELEASIARHPAGKGRGR